MPNASRTRNLVLVLGDQLSDRLQTFAEFDRKQDKVFMAEVTGESRYVWSSKMRTTLFLVAMRRFAENLRGKGIDVLYRKLDDSKRFDSIGSALVTELEEGNWQKVLVTQPGEYRLIAEIESACEEAGVELVILEDDSFYCNASRFDEYAKGKKQLRMEYFYREMRREHSILMEDGEPAGGKWNFDSSNRKSFGKGGPEALFPRKRFKPGKVLEDVTRSMDTVFADHPGFSEDFDWPTTREEALEALSDFIDNNLAQFGAHQDAMWNGEPFLNHSLISSSLNLKLIDAREAVDAALEAYEKGRAPIESVEGFVRQILGWREYVRGIYWRYMPDYLDRNELGATNTLPKFYWDGSTDMSCMRDVITQTIKHGYAHHIQRLMVTGLYALLRGVDPKEVHGWYLAVYIDAVEWVELPNTLGMSQYADGGVMASKPYVASGKYIDKMSNYCSSCRYDPSLRSGKDACPFTVLYWDFLDRHKKILQSNSRMTMQLRNLDRLDAKELEKVRSQARELKSTK
ncbi:cryptochrome/photolyase family protein [Pelagicoccus albus]|uniref:Cryptochrome/photolyase family protein n=1 Tax=Pelagicoccus albus TaxID=415222 RepID=A0A7X1B5B7_9BACT|nr:cryptochrome/photolyase family protein [Pelagicoccus albus]MBC2605941.1 cryptochrome/photolyase family protein [Pelagicoccus albus]